MKNYKRILLFCAVLPIMLWISFANNISETNKSKIDKIMVVVDRQWWNEEAFSQISRYEKIINSFWKLRLEDKDQKELITYMVECFQNRVDALKSQVLTQNQIISNVDRDKVKEEWLAWHNYEREQAWLSPYSYNNSLNYTALLWAQKIASESRKTWTTHARKSGDWYRNTDSIREWFADLWVNITYFSESNAYGYYNCKKSDCTQEMIDALRTCFTRTLLDRTHHPAVVSSIYNEIWLWVATNWTYVWLTTHYWKDIK